MTEERIKDLDKLIIIAQTYGYIKGKFTARQLYDFLLSKNYGFHNKGFTSRAIGVSLKNSRKFTKEVIKGKTVYSVR